MDGLELGRMALTEGYGLLDPLTLHHSIVYSLIEPEIWSFQERLVSNGRPVVSTNTSYARLL